MDLSSNPSSSRCQRKRTAISARRPVSGCNRAEGPLLPRVRRGGGTSISSKARKKRQKIGRKRTNLSADSIVLHRAKVFRTDDDDDDEDGGCPAGRNRRQTGGERRGKMRASLTEAETRFCHEKVGVARLSRNEGRQERDVPFGHFRRRRRGSLVEGGEGPIPEARTTTTSSRNFWSDEKQASSLVPRGLKNLMLARCK